MAANKRSRLYRIVKYDVYIYSTSKRNAKKHWEKNTGLNSGKICWVRYRKISIFNTI